MTVLVCLSCAHATCRYTGEFKLDVKDGKGVEKWADGTVFEGFFK